MSIGSEAESGPITPKEVLIAADIFITKLVSVASITLDVELSVFFWSDPATGHLKATHSSNSIAIGVESVLGAGIEGIS